jgi:hypothetical protein
VGRFSLAIQTFLRILHDAPFADQVRGLVKGQQGPFRAEQRQVERALSVEAIQMLAILQREGRLLDFLFESIDDYSDERVGAVVRSIHAGCRRALDEYFRIEAIRLEQEGEEVMLEEEVNPSIIRLTGEPGNQPPFIGKLVHHGWRATKGHLPPQPEGQDRSVIQPAEIEISS